MFSEWIARCPVRAKNKCAKDEQVQRALQQLEPFSGFLGRHITCVSGIWVRCQPNDWPTIGRRLANTVIALGGSASNHSRCSASVANQGHRAAQA